MYSEKQEIKSDNKEARQEEALPGEVLKAAEGSCYIVLHHLEDFWPGCEDFLSQYRYYFALGGAQISQEELSPEMRSFLTTEPEKVIYLDIETGGESEVKVFLIGLMHFAEGKFEIKQVFARDLSEEKAVLVRTRDFLNSFEVLVTYNGRIFDIPFLAERAGTYGIPFKLTPVHLDLLVEARRRWRGLIPDLRLSTLQTLISGAKLREPLGKEEISRIYEDFMEKKSLQRLPQVFRHNGFDLIATAQVALSLICGDEPFRGP
jgi:uncharacterized protein YprB with RNaseH-like and TPR domain